METLQRMPSKITNAYLKLQVLLQEIEAKIVQFTDLPSDTPGLHLLAQDIVQKFIVLRNKFTAESVSHDSLPDDLLEIEAKLRDLEAEFYRSNVDSAFTIVDHDDDVSEHGSVCESCLNDDPQFDGGDVSSVHELPELLDEYEVTVPPSPEEFSGEEMNLITPERVEEALLSDCKKEKTGKRRRRWWWRTVVILMLASVVWAVSYFDKKREGFLVPT